MLGLKPSLLSNHVISAASQREDPDVESSRWTRPWEPRRNMTSIALHYILFDDRPRCGTTGGSRFEFHKHHSSGDCVGNIISICSTAVVDFQQSL